MRIYDIDYPPVMNASGARGFFQEGYWYHPYWKLAGLTFDRCGFTAKTTTMQARLMPDEKLGNMHMLADGITPRDYFPPCIIVKPFSGVALNAVGLSGPGAPDLLKRGIWQQITGTPWNLSFMSVGKTLSDRMDELREFVQVLKPEIPKFKAPVGLELNFSCPNANTHLGNVFVQEVGEALSIARELGIPLQCKLNALTQIDDAYEISRNRDCDAIVMGNTIPWGSRPEIIHWKQLFGSDTSPLAQFGGGGLSGPPLRIIHCQWIRIARQWIPEKPIWGCGGIDSPAAVREYKMAGASGIQFGTVCITRPWRTNPIIRAAYDLFT